MVLVYHKIEHPDGFEAGASVDVFLEKGLKSKLLLQKEGKLPSEPNPWERMLARHKELENKHLNNPVLLKYFQTQHQEELQKNSYEAFYKPNYPGNRLENVFFSYSDGPPSSHNRDWVAIDVPETSKLHDAGFRDEIDPQKWMNTRVTIEAYSEMLKRGEEKPPSGWTENYPPYNELLIRDEVKADKIVAYAKVEKELPIEKDITPEELKNVQKFISEKLGFATQFKNPEDNALIHKNDKTQKYEIRVSFNKNKINGKEGQVSDFFNKFQSFQQLIDQSVDQSEKPSASLKATCFSTISAFFASIRGR
jgi:hypothetical protein